MKTLLALAVSLSATTALAQTTKPAGDLIPRDVLFGNPDHAAVKISPDGKHLSYAAPVDGVLNLWVAPTDHPDQAKAITRDTGRGVTQYFWAYDNAHLVYLQDKNGNENFDLYSVDLADGTTKPLYENPQVRVEIDGTSEKFPSKILIGLNDRVAPFHDLYEIDVATGEKTPVLQNPGTIDGNYVAGFAADDDFRVRFALAFASDGGMVVYEKEKGGDDKQSPATTRAGDWKQWRKIDFQDTLSTNLAGFADDGKTLYMADSAGRDTAALYAVDLQTGGRTLLAENDDADVGNALVQPRTKKVQAVAFDYEKTQWTVLDDAIRPDVARLEKLAAGGEWVVTDRSLDDKAWTVYTTRSDGPTTYYLYDRGGDGSMTKLFSNNERVEKLADAGRLRPMEPVVIPARDGTKLVSYLTLPHDRAPVAADVVGAVEWPVPMVLLVHGGPWARDDYGYNPLHQWLADRGYAVLSVNFRGSTGFGKALVNAGNEQWGRAMQDDLTDAVKWAVDNGVARQDKVAIMGGSYGGYATLAGVTMTPDLYAAGVDIVGPSNILTLLKTIPPYWKPAIVQFYTRVGDPTTDAGKALLEAASPINHVAAIRAPLLIGQGQNDPRVNVDESKQIVDAMNAKQIPVTYVVYPDEGHGFLRPENRMSFFGVAEAFLADHLGGRYQPLTAGDLEGSSMTVPDGAADVPGLETAMKK